MTRYHMNWNAFIVIIYIFIGLGAAAEAVFFFLARKKALEIRDSALAGSLTSKATGESLFKKVSYRSRQDFLDASSLLKLLYSIYSNISAIFPLLGILGTVVSLINMTDMTSAAESFMSALDTTLWGLVCGILSKMADSWLSPHYETALDEADLIIHNEDWVAPESFTEEDQALSEMSNGASAKPAVDYSHIDVEPLKPEEIKPGRSEKTE